MSQKRNTPKILFDVPLFETQKNGKHYSNHNELLEMKKEQKKYILRLRDHLRNKKKFIITPIKTKGRNVELNYENIKLKKKLEKRLGIKIPYSNADFLQD
tara:strand:+ start:5169 stop:5468 length:300 start_codon:yes stop_codon:yes gene_type:complete